MHSSCTYTAGAGKRKKSERIDMVCVLEKKWRWQGSPQPPALWAPHCSVIVLCQSTRASSFETLLKGETGDSRVSMIMKVDRQSFLLLQQARFYHEDVVQTDSVRDSSETFFPIRAAWKAEYWQVKVKRTKACDRNPHFSGDANKEEDNDTQCPVSHSSLNYLTQHQQSPQYITHSYRHYVHWLKMFCVTFFTSISAEARNHLRQWPTPTLLPRKNHYQYRHTCVFEVLRTNRRSRKFLDNTYLSTRAQHEIKHWAQK